MHGSLDTDAHDGSWVRAVFSLQEDLTVHSIVMVTETPSLVHPLSRLTYFGQLATNCEIQLTPDVTAICFFQLIISLSLSLSLFISLSLSLSL